MSTLVHKSYKQYENVSRYTPFPYYYDTEARKYLYGITAQIDKDNTLSVAHTVKRNETLDYLADYYYGNPLYYWCIADYNDITDPYEDLSEGTVLSIPTFSNIRFKLGG